MALSGYLIYFNRWWLIIIQYNTNFEYWNKNKYKNQQTNS